MFINDIITVEELQHLRCQARLLVPLFSTIRYGKKSLSYWSPVLWNTLDNDIKQQCIDCIQETIEIMEGSYTCNCGFCAQCRISNRWSWILMLMIISLIFCTHDIFFSFVYFVVNIVYFVVHIVCEVDVIASSLVLYLQFCSTLNTNFFFFFFFMVMSIYYACACMCGRFVQAFQPKCRAAKKNFMTERCYN